MLEVYCDESDSHIAGHPLLVIAGYVAEKSAWDDFGRKWKEQILGHFKIPYFHSTEIRSKHSKYYRHLSINERRSLLSAASRLICEHVNSGVAVYMRPHDWNCATSPDQRSRWGSTYGACMELLVSALSQYLSAPARVSVFLESGHSNSNDALARVRNYKRDTEPIEWPNFDADFVRLEDDPSRTSSVRIGEIGLVSKKESMAVQAADLLAYLVAAASREKTHPVFEGVLDTLIIAKPHRISGWGPRSVQQLVERILSYEDLQLKRRERTWELKKRARSQGHTYHELPWGLAVDKSQTPDDSSLEFRKQIESIRNRLKQI